MYPRAAAALSCVVLALALVACGLPQGNQVGASSVATATPTITSATPTPVTPTPPASSHTSGGQRSVSTSGSSPTPLPHTPAIYLTQTVIAERSGPIPTPPAGTLTHAGRTQVGETGSHTWTSSTGKSFHGDARGIPVPEEALTVPAGATLTFVFGGINPPAILTAQAYPPTNQFRCTATARCIPHRQSDMPLPASLSGHQAAITADLPAGEYVIVVEVIVTSSPASREQGRVPYSFRVVIAD